MPRHGKVLSTAFVGGEMSPEMVARVDDVPRRVGAALVRNMICKVQGSVFRRPGTRLLRAAKNSGKRVRLLEFKYSNDQTMVIEAGRTDPAQTDGREIGYFRFHTNGGTLLYTQPAAYVSSKAIAVVDPVTNLFTCAGHGFVTGNLIVFTMAPTVSITFTAGAPGQCNLAGADTILGHGTPVTFEATGGGALPAELETRRTYYAFTPDATSFRISREQFGTPLNFSGTGSGTRNMASMPTVSGLTLKPKIHYAAVFDTVNTFLVAKDPGTAATGPFFDILLPGNGDLRVHYAYNIADIVEFGGVHYYAMKVPWGFYDDPFNGQPEHLDHAPTVLNYWCRLPGVGSAVTISTVTHFVTWVAGAHGLNNGDPVIFNAAAAPTPVVLGQVYYVREKTSTTFRISATPAGPLITFSSAGTTVTAVANTFYDVPHYYSEAELFRLQTAQSADVMTITSKDHPAAELRRYGPMNWAWTYIGFGQGVAPPTNVIPFLVTQGEGFQVTAVNTATPGQLTLPTPHQFTDGEVVHVTGISAGGPADGLYAIHDATAVATTFVFLRDLFTGASISTIAAAGLNGRIRRSSSSAELFSTYVVTAVSAESVESIASNPCVVTNNLTVPGASNTISWTASLGAVRYRVYKQQNNLYGFIGDTDTTSFKDDDIIPDLSISPPIRDEVLLTSYPVGFDTPNDLVLRVGHGVTSGDPIVFATNDTLPTGLVEGTTYYAIVVSADSFKVSDFADLSNVVNLGGSPAGTHTVYTGAFPSTVTYFEQRRGFATGQDVVFTASGTESDISYSLPTVDSDRIRFRVATREVCDIRSMVPLSHLMLLASSLEFRVTPINDDALTPSSISVRPQSYVGCGFVQPTVVNNNVVFAAARGGHVRELGFDSGAGGYLTGDMSLRAVHLFEDFEIVQQTHQKAPLSTMWFISTSGKLLGLTYYPEEKIGAWHQHDTAGGLFESVASVAEGAEDRVYVVVKRGNVRYIERMASQQILPAVPADSFFVDSGMSYVGTPTTTVSGLNHLIGSTVNILADGVKQTPQVVSAAGSITLQTAASTIHVGLPMVSQLQTLPIALTLDAMGMGRQKNITHAYVRVHESGAFRLGPTLADMAPSQVPASGLLTDQIEVLLPASWNDEGQIFIEQADPLPLTVIGLTLEAAVGG